MATTARKDLTHLCRALKTPSLLASIDRHSKRAREDSWSHEEFLAACLERELSARQTHGGDNRIKAGADPLVDSCGADQAADYPGGVISVEPAGRSRTSRVRPRSRGPAGTSEAKASIAWAVRATLADAGPQP